MALLKPKDESLSGLPNSLRLAAAAGGISLSLGPEECVKVARDLDEGRKAVALQAEARMVRDMAQEALDAAQAAMPDFTAMARRINRLAVQATLGGMLIGALTALTVLDLAGVLSW